MAGPAKNLSCPKCSAPITVRGFGQTNTLICSSCMSALDLEHPELKILYEASNKRKFEPLIPLGTRGKLRGDLWEVIGFMRRSDSSGMYVWSEYLLFNPKIGFRWLVHNNGHWNYVVMTKSKPTGSVAGGMKMLGEHYQHFLSGKVITRYVLGEFYWRAKDGDSVFGDDFVHPPRMLSRESQTNETVWSIGEYVEPEVIQKAFNIKKMPDRIGVAPNQINPSKAAGNKIYWMAFLTLIVLTFIQVLFSSGASSKSVFSGRSDEGGITNNGVIVSQPFKLDNGTKNLGIYAHSPVTNNWVYLTYTLFNKDTGESWQAGREISYYEGYDSDGRWSEGSRYDKVIFPSIPSGTYVLSVASEGGSLPSPPYSINVIRNMTYWGNYLFAAGLILIFPLILGFFHYRFEVQRWEESDHPIHEEDDE